VSGQQRQRVEQAGQVVRPLPVRHLRPVDPFDGVDARPPPGARRLRLVRRRLLRPASVPERHVAAGLPGDLGAAEPLRLDPEPEPELLLGRQPLVDQLRHVEQDAGGVAAMRDGQRVLERLLRDALHELRLHPRREPELAGLQDDRALRPPGGALLLERLVERRHVRRRRRSPGLPRPGDELHRALVDVQDRRAVRRPERRVVTEPLANLLDLERPRHDGRRARSRWR
jgi:hypothetical protein